MPEAELTSQVRLFASVMATCRSANAPARMAPDLKLEKPAAWTGSVVCDGEPTSPVMTVVPPALLVIDVPASTPKLAAVPRFTPAAGGKAAAVTVSTAAPLLAPDV